MTDRTCGTCTLCCKLDTVKDINKPAGVLCRHCAVGRGCKIYEKRPFSCRMYQCSWLANPQVWADKLRPDRCGFVMELTEDGKVLKLLCDPKLMRTHRRKVEMQQAIEQMRQHWTVVVVHNLKLGKAGDVTVYLHHRMTQEQADTSIQATEKAQHKRTQEAIANGHIRLPAV